MKKAPKRLGIEVVLSEEERAKCARYAEEQCERRLSYYGNAPAFQRDYEFAGKCGEVAVKSVLQEAGWAVDGIDFTLHSGSHQPDVRARKDGQERAFQVKVRRVNARIPPSWVINTHSLRKYENLSGTLLLLATEVREGVFTLDWVVPVQLLPELLEECRSPFQQSKGNQRAVYASKLEEISADFEKEPS